MKSISKQEFRKIYEEKFAPIAKILEPTRLENIQKKKAFGSKYLIFAIITLIAIVCACLYYRFDLFQVLLVSVVILTIPYLAYISKINQKEREVLKNSLISKILKVFGEIYFSENKQLIPKSEIKDMGLYPKFTSKCSDDVIVGKYNECNFLIDECRLTHTERRGKSTVTVTDFSGIIVKIQMHKKFSGKTVVGPKGDITKFRGAEEVQLESVEFMKHRKVYSTDQIESRYLLTTSFMERITELGNTFMKNRMGDTQVDTSQIKNVLAKLPIEMELPFSSTSIGFVNGYAYIFIPTYENFFEIDTNRTLLDPYQYYDIYMELASILDIIDFLKFNQKLGL